ncbi:MULTISPECIES: response regulator [Rathayibacter]|jgi:two-component system KDP operon response regulator KdpE|uniref:DNA-binding response regulator n=2 Tax=Rathayibacter festucae TaxID=110937 RepID=A0A3Q9UYD4_9MICO|nr:MULTISPECIES: response regulator [Rathayibacter]AZZ53405.1 DNA-binding response regulator [Rathayibacter festucae DSM 15932]QHC61278.1 response regulator [Rathayibacter festucae]ROQ03543.1 two-component system KDP operon response regulator KdpE [Rathayibacter sp. PhB93]ROS22009.1 two-component system KDP operon response regulator KdpE [Rathayibacter sp. PhB127]TDQ10568.1 two-component system KDP operon response regulator KdpE [Rathayibacter sp. PhB1]
MKILIADDDPQILRALRITLTARGYDVVTAGDGTEAINRAIDERPDLYMIDLGMPRLDGVEVIQALRGWTSAPVLVVSGRTGSADKVGALDAGADDYVTKPFSMDEVLARIRALSRRVQPAEGEPTVRIGDVTVDLAAKSAMRDGAAVRLTPTEWQVLEILVRNAGKLVTRRSLLDEIWGPTHVTDTGYLRLYLAQLRKKLEPDPAHPRFLLTEAGMGYRFVPGEDAAAR